MDAIFVLIGLIVVMMVPFFFRKWREWCALSYFSGLAR